MKKDVIWMARGAVSAAKTSLINALMGDILSPMDVNESTVCRTVFANANAAEQRLVVQHADGRTEEAPLSSLPFYSGETSVSAETVLRCFTPVVPKGVEFADLPGEGSLSRAYPQSRLSEDLSTADGILHVLPPRGIPLSLPPPTPWQHHYVILNKRDQLATPGSDLSKSAKDRLVECVYEELKTHRYEDARVFSCSPLSFLAATAKNARSEEAFQALLAIAKWGYEKKISNQLLQKIVHPLGDLNAIPGGIPLSMEARSQIVASLVPGAERHGWPVFRVVLLLARQHPDMSVSRLRKKLRNFSGIDKLRKAILQDSERKGILKFRAERRRTQEQNRQTHEIATLQNRIGRLHSALENGGIYDMKLALEDMKLALEADAASLAADLSLSEIPTDIKMPERLAENHLANADSESPTSPIVVATIETTEESRIHIAWQTLIYVDREAKYQRSTDPATDSFTSVVSKSRAEIESDAAPGLERLKRCVVSGGVESLLIAVDTRDEALIEMVSKLFADTSVQISTCALAAADTRKGAPQRQRPSLVVDTHLRQMETALEMGNYAEANAELHHAKKLAAKLGEQGKQGAGASILERYEKKLLRAVESAAASATGGKKAYLLKLQAALASARVKKEDLAPLFFSFASESPPGYHAATDLQMIADFFA